MYTKAALIDIHTRTHRSLEKFCDHLAAFSDDELRRELEGFGAGCILAQLDHLIGAEEYWIWVASDAAIPNMDDSPPPALADLRVRRGEVAASTQRYINEASEEVLNARAMKTTYGGNQAELIPAQIVMRTQTHIFQHLGQISAICRLLGKPIPQGLDFPLRD